MRALAGCMLVLMAGIGCAGAPPREKPVLEPPAPPMSPEEASASESSPSIIGAWGSVSLKGPGSASYRRMDLILHGDGRYVFVGEAQDGTKAVHGRYTWAEGVLTLAREDGTTMRFGCRREGTMLVLTDRGSELRLAAVRP